MRLSSESLVSGCCTTGLLWAALEPRRFFVAEASAAAADAAAFAGAALAPRRSRPDRRGAAADAGDGSGVDVTDRALVALGDLAALRDLRPCAVCVFAFTLRVRRPPAAAPAADAPLAALASSPAAAAADLRFLALVRRLDRRAPPAAAAAGDDPASADASAAAAFARCRNDRVRRAGGLLAPSPAAAGDDAPAPAPVSVSAPAPAPSPPPSDTSESLRAFEVRVEALVAALAAAAARRDDRRRVTGAVGCGGVVASVPAAALEADAFLDLACRFDADFAPATFVARPRVDRLPLFVVLPAAEGGAKSPASWSAPAADAAEARRERGDLVLPDRERPRRLAAPAPAPAPSALPLRGDRNKLRVRDGAACGCSALYLCHASVCACRQCSHLHRRLLYHALPHGLCCGVAWL